MPRFAGRITTVVLLSSLEFGCGGDAFFAVRQPVRLCVTDAVNGEALVGAEIKFAYRAEVEPNEQTSFAERDHTLASTDNAGCATVPVEYAWIVGGLIAQEVEVTRPDGSTKREWHARGLLIPFSGDTDTRRDRVTGKTYWCRVEHNGHKEIMPIRLDRGAVLTGCLFSLQIVSVGPPERIR